MLSAVRFPRYVGVAPGTTTLTMNGADYPPYPPPDGGPGVPPYPTQAWLVPEPSSDGRIRMALPPNQHVTSAREMIVSVPNAQASMGPAPTDAGLAKLYQYQPVHRGWIQTRQGGIFNLQGTQPQIKIQGSAGLGEGMSGTEKWAIFASVMSGLALATTAVIAVLRYKRGR